MEKKSSSHPLAKKFTDISGIIIPKGEALQQEILTLKKEKNALILSDEHQDEDILQLSDIKFSGNNPLPKITKSAEFIVVCSTHTEAEKIKSSLPEKKVLMPDEKNAANLETLFLCLKYEAPEIH